MSKHVIHAHSSIPGKIPSVSQLNYGEIAINYAAGAEKISIKNTDDEVVEFIPSSQAVGMRTASGGEIFNDYSRNAASFRSHAEGVGTYAVPSMQNLVGAHAEGAATSATSLASHAEGFNTFSEGHASHAEGLYTRAISQSTHAEGSYSTAIAIGSHAEGLATSATGEYSHSEGMKTNTYNQAEHACGKYNFSIPKSADTTYSGSIFTVGVGKSDDDRKNAIMVDNTGGVYFYGLGGYDGTYATHDVSPAMNLSGVLSTIYESLQAEIQGLRATIEQLTPLKYTLAEIVGYAYGVKSNNFSTSGNTRKYEGRAHMEEVIFDNILAECQSGRPVIITGVITGSTYSYNDLCTLMDNVMTATCTVASYSYLSGSTPVLTLTLMLPPVEVSDCTTTLSSKTIPTRTVAGYLILRKGDVATYYMADIG